MRSWIRRLGVAVALPLVVFGAAPSALLAPAAAAPAPVSALPATAPFRLAGHIVDQAGVLSASDESTVQAAVDKLSAEDKLALWVVFVPTFTTQVDPQTWAQSTFTASQLGTDDALLAVAVTDTAAYFGANSSFPVSGTKLNSIYTDNVKPQLSQHNWAAAAVAAADGLRSASGSSSNAKGIVSIVVGVIVIVGAIAGVVWWRRRQQRGPATASGQGQGAAPARASGPYWSGDDSPAAQPAAPLEPYGQLSDRSVQQLIATDNALRTSQAQLSTAELTFGKPAVADFTAAVEQAHGQLADAFQLRQQIDDEIEEDEATRRGWMAEIIRLCGNADSVLDQQSDRFDSLLDIRTRLPEVLHGLPAAIDAQAARLPASTATLQQLAARYDAAALATVSGNATEASGRLDFARGMLDQASAAEAPTDQVPAAAGAPGGSGAATTTQDPAQAALAARSAQEGVAQARTLLDAVDKLAADLATAAGQMPARRAEVQQELAAARAAFGQGATGTAGDDLTRRLDEVDRTLAETAGSTGEHNPVAALDRIRDADQTLDVILADTRTAQQNQQRAGAAAGEAVAAAQTRIDNVGDYLTTRRGAIGSEARTRLAEAERHLAQARAATDPAVALSEARQAANLADQALDEAQQDYDSFGGGGFGGGGGYRRGWGGGGYGGGGYGGVGGAFGGAVLGGILGGILSGGDRGYGGGFGGGGFGGGYDGGGGFGGGGGGFDGGGGGGDFGGGGGRF